MKVSTYLPIFPGFYNTLFEVDYDIIEADIRERVEPRNADDAVEFFHRSDHSLRAWTDYEKEVCQKCAEFIESQLKPKFIEAVVFESLYSPLEYNFDTDAIYVEFEISPRNVKNIRTFITQHAEDWKQYLSGRYTSRDGFMSYYGNTPEHEDWKDIGECLAHEHKSGSIFDFICAELGISQEDMYYAAETYPYIDIESLVKDFEASAEKSD